MAVPSASDVIEVSFGVTLDTQVGAIISSAKAGTHLDVRLRWSAQRPAGGVPPPAGAVT
ncbi:hypothetical protein [Streptomyces sp. VRA16 Mangrove soil]|uniref:hypothetical protein n=1 Tax=Streptomyces sp. VRA16 Mangrove soil TaxID=2817434 RepID=UPI001A9F022B|nr:hypothetical protein [Streptomyces sp. VRA16 Mangrove soil]MBO1329934.1 hypothetical protein [Streptomyces sp. VRA16 Mangrove soil]